MKNTKAIFTTEQNKSISELFAEAKKEGDRKRKSEFISDLIASFYFGLGLVGLVLTHEVYNHQKVKYLPGGTLDGFTFDPVGFYVMAFLCLVVSSCSFLIVMKDNK